MFVSFLLVSWVCILGLRLKRRRRLAVWRAGWARARSAAALCVASVAGGRLCACAACRRVMAALVCFSFLPGSRPGSSSCGPAARPSPLVSSLLSLLVSFLIFYLSLSLPLLFLSSSARISCDAPWLFMAASVRRLLGFASGRRRLLTWSAARRDFNLA